MQDASQSDREQQRTEVELLGRQARTLNRDDYQIEDVATARLKIG